MVDISIVTETSLEANWNRRTDGQDHVLSQADALTKNFTTNLAESLNLQNLVIASTFCLS